MKATLKRLFIRLKTAHYIGKPVRFAIAVYRIPRSRAQLISVLETLPRLEAAYREQLPSLLETISKLNQRQHQIDRDLPVALRKLRQEIGSLEQKELDKNAGLSANVTYLLNRVEFVRRELMFEMRYGSKTITPNGDKLEVHTKVLAADKLASARASKLRLNLGCGHV